MTDTISIGYPNQTLTWAEFKQNVRPSHRSLIYKLAPGLKVLIENTFILGEEQLLLGDLASPASFFVQDTFLGKFVVSSASYSCAIENIRILGPKNSNKAALNIISGVKVANSFFVARNIFIGDLQGSGFHSFLGSTVQLDSVSVKNCNNRGFFLEDSVGTLKNCISEKNRHGIHLLGSDFNVQNCIARNNVKHGIVATHCDSGFQINNCVSYRNGRSGVVVGGTKHRPMTNRNWVIEGVISVSNHQLGFTIDPTERNNANPITQNGKMTNCISVRNKSHGFNFTHCNEVCGRYLYSLKNRNIGIAIAKSKNVNLENIVTLFNKGAGLAQFGSGPLYGNITATVLKNRGNASLSRGGLSYQKITDQ